MTLATANVPATIRSMVILGVRPTADIAWLAIVEGREALPLPDRFQLNNEPRPASLLSGLDEAGLLLQRHNIDGVAVVDAHSNKKPKSYKVARRRLILESLLELAAARADVEYHVLSPQAIQSALDLPTRRIQDHVDSVIEGAGARWSQRGPAALAALALAVQKAEG